MAHLSQACLSRGGRLYLSHFPIEQGKWRIWKALEHVIEFESLPVTVRKLPNGSIMKLDPAEAVDRFIYFWDQWEPNETWLTRQLLRPGDTFVDVGANIGYFSLLAATLVGPSGRVIAVEATPPTVARLIENIRLNGFTNIEVHAGAALETSGGTVRILRQNTRNSGMNSLRPRPGAEGWDVPSLCLDDILRSKRIDLLKMDIEGAELHALRGLRSTLASDRPPALVVEIWPEFLTALGGDHREIFDFLCSFGYKAFAVGDRKLLRLTDGDIAATAGMNAFFTKHDP